MIVVTRIRHFSHEGSQNVAECELQIVLRKKSNCPGQSFCSGCRAAALYLREAKEPMDQQNFSDEMGLQMFSSHEDGGRSKGMWETALSALSLQMELGSFDLDLFSLGEEVIWKIFPKLGTPNTNINLLNNNSYKNSDSNSTNENMNENMNEVNDNRVNTNLSANEATKINGGRCRADWSA